MMKPIILFVLDGWGISSAHEYDAQARAHIPFYKALLEIYPHTALECAGEAVGLPEGTMGNSEVGHLNLGAGRVVYQDYARINKAIKDGEFIKNQAFVNAMDGAVKNKGAVHFLGLLSDAGVHSHIDHLYALIDLATSKGVEKIFVHAFMDGRDTPPDSGINYIKNLEAILNDKPAAQIATVTGRFWAMDRDNRWKRVEQAYKGLVLGQGKKVRTATEAVEESYKANEMDEFIKPSIICNGEDPIGNISDGDSVVFFNFRADRAREISAAIAGKDFKGFPRDTVPELNSYVTMTMYEDDFDFPVAFAPIKHTNILGEVLSGQGLKQLRIAETEKYAHVTYFFNGGQEDPFPGEDRCLIPSPQEVATYDLKPEMSAYEVTDEVLRRLDQNTYDFILLNFANPDMVGHTGIMDAAIKACETIDACLKRIVEKVRALGGLAIITADHGNCEQMQNNTGPHTAHTLNPVPFLLINEDVKLRDKGILADVAPTVLDIMGIKQPEEMTGKSLIKR